MTRNYSTDYFLIVQQYVNTKKITPVCNELNLFYDTFVTVDFTDIIKEE